MVYATSKAKYNVRVLHSSYKVHGISWGGRNMMHFSKLTKEVSKVSYRACLSADLKVHWKIFS